MDNKKLIAQALLDIAKNSETIFIEAEDKELIDAAKKIGIILPSPDLAVIKTVYAEIDKENKNGVILSKKAVEKGIQTLIGKQINFEHDGAGRICGYSISSSIVGNKIEIIGVIFKSLFPQEMTIIKEKFANKELAVSFEIWNTTKDGKSVVKIRPDGLKEIDPIMFHGTGLLLASKPACPKAKVFKLIADTTNIIKESIEKIFDNNLVYASLAVEESACKKCTVCNCEKEDKKVDEYLLELAVDNVIELKEEEITSLENDYDVEFEEAKKLTYEEKKNLPDEDFAVVITVKNKVTGEPRKIRMFVIKDEAHVRNALARLGQDAVKETLKKLGVSIEEVKNKILKKAKELNMTDLLEKYKAEVAPEPAKVAEPASQEQTPGEQAQVENKPKFIVKVTREYSENNVDTYVDGTPSGTSIRTGHNKTRITTEYSDGTKDIVESDSDNKTIYTLSELEVKIADAIKVANDAKDVEINSIKVELETLKTAKETEISTLKAEKDAVKIELEQKTQEIATLKIEKAKVEEKKPEINFGAVKEPEEKEKRKKIRENVDSQAFPKK